MKTSDSVATAHRQYLAFAAIAVEQEMAICAVNLRQHSCGNCHRLYDHFERSNPFQMPLAA
jgi:hypothetical protein